MPCRQAYRRRRLTSIEGLHGVVLLSGCWRRRGRNRRRRGRLSEGTATTGRADTTLPDGRGSRFPVGGTTAVVGVEGPVVVQGTFLFLESLRDDRRHLFLIYLQLFIAGIRLRFIVLSFRKNCRLSTFRRVLVVVCLDSLLIIPVSVGTPDTRPYMHDNIDKDLPPTIRPLYKNRNCQHLFDLAQVYTWQHRLWKKQTDSKYPVKQTSGAYFHIAKDIYSPIPYE